MATGSLQNSRNGPKRPKAHRVGGPVKDHAQIQLPLPSAQEFQSGVGVQEPKALIEPIKGIYGSGQAVIL